VPEDPHEYVVRRDDPNGYDALRRWVMETGEPRRWRWDETKAWRTYRYARHDGREYGRGRGAC
jgi:hypothetical protein